MTMQIKPIRNERDHRAALQEIDALWDARPRTPRGDRLEVLATLVEAYEQRRHAIQPPDPIEAIKFRMEQLGLTKSDLAPYLGGKNRVSEVLSRKRRLTVGMMRKLHQTLNIPAESLLAC
jgi:HTH-type transcriptional regulator/antitoxin HigA